MKSSILTNSAKHRAISLDALRGLSIMAMVLSSTIAFGILPGWMYHMQVPPPNHVYCEDIAGLTWVDLVFPLFLFAMGAAFPFSVRRKYEKEKSYSKSLYSILTRWCKLIFFAIFIQHFYPFTLSSPQDMRAWMLAIMSFVLLFPMYMRLPSRISWWVRVLIKAMAYGIAVVMLLFTHYANEPSLNLYNSNIIIVVLANMALFGSVIYLFTMNSLWARVVILLLLAGIFFSAGVEGSWAKQLYDFSPCKWACQFSYLHYLYIVIPGTLAGDVLRKWLDAESCRQEKTSSPWAYAILLVSALVVLAVLVGLYNRWSFCTLLVTGLLLYILWLMVSRCSTQNRLWSELLLLAISFTMMGLCFEPFQGGIKKDGPTISYLLLSSGIGFIILLMFHILTDDLRCRRLVSCLSYAGQNPMLAYVLSGLFISPLLNIFGLMQYVDKLTVNPWCGFLRGVLLTSLVLAITVFFTKRKLFWRT